MRTAPGDAGNASRFDALVLNVETRAGLCAVRALGRAGYRPAGAAWGRAPGLRSRYLAEAIALPIPNQDFGITVERLLEWLADARADATLAATDATLDLLDEQRDALASLAPPAIGARRAIRTALSKVATLELAQASGVPTPAGAVVRSAGELTAALEGVGAPLVVKPDAPWIRHGSSGRHVRSVFAATKEAARAGAAPFLEEGVPVVLQEVLDGRRENHMVFRVGSRTVARCVLVAERTWPPLGGNTIMRTTISPPPDSIRHADTLLDALELEGFAEVEFRRDARGVPRVMEVNARLSQALAGAVAAGFNFPEMLVRWTRGQKVEAPTRYPVGVRVGWLMGELRLLGATLGVVPSGSPPPRANALLRDLAGDYLVGGARLEELDWRDARPLLASTGETVGSLVRRRASAARDPGGGGSSSTNWQ